jgi:hypothetical protein
MLRVLYDARRSSRYISSSQSRPAREVDGGSLTSISQEMTFNFDAHDATLFSEPYSTVRLFARLRG